MRLPQRSLRSEDGRTAEAALPLEQGSGRLAGRGLAGRFSAGRLRASACGVGMCGGAGGRLHYMHRNENPISTPKKLDHWRQLFQNGYNRFGLVDTIAYLCQNVRERYSLSYAIS